MGPLNGTRWLATALLVLGASQASAAKPPLDRTFPAQLFHPSAGPDEFLALPTARPLAHLNFSLGLWLNYALDPLTIRTVNAAGQVGDPRARLVAHMLGADLVASLGLWHRFQIGLGVPATLYQTGEDFAYTFNGAAQTARAPSGFALGDPWLDLRARFWGKERGTQIGARILATFPASLATANRFGGDASVVLGGDLLAGFEADRFRAGLSIGFHWRPSESHFFSTTIGSRLAYGAAFAYDVLEARRLTLLAEVRGATDVSGSSVANVDASPVELDVAARTRLARAWQLTLGIGTGLHMGLGTPTLRVLGAVTWSPDRRDRDRDGVPDADDRCPDQPEDRDGFRDDDGCPDPDNDGDLLPDARDRCPNDAEDMDGFQDEDGCPDLDDDGDGVPDRKDACPRQKEDREPPSPADGCPGDKDRDGDGVFDAQDKCPDEAEDRDRFQDEDGCPDPDNDGDGVPDAQDRCPTEPETINGVADDDGCPDEGAARVAVRGDEILILDKVYFDTDRTTIQRRSHSLLDQVAATLRAHVEIRKLRVEGHTDSRGGARHNQKLSQGRAEAVRAYLVERGIDAGRLVAEGFGPTRPIADNRTGKGREANRRVEFHIVERAAGGRP